MPPRVTLNPHLSLDRLRDRYRQAKEATEARRWHLLYLIAQGWTITQAARVVDLSYDYAKELVRRYNQLGPNAIDRRPSQRHRSARSLLTTEQQQELAQLLDQPAPDGGPWSGPKVAQWIAERTGRDRVWPQRGWEYLQRLQEGKPSNHRTNGKQH
ncbi:MAG: helix-turn-helix domain-containing protein [Limnothrix sp.]|jgi:molybdate transport repressor ModE-like protein|uniref:Helix-turn-helix domain-containing protein n=1 Tax=Limnothrix redekei LRLZ20PSL1 TaxID=3112953 RepID=A0ABW7CCS1_9CYAN|nr:MULTISPECIES: helix-turn-helix domain-containing protein [unclassified Limnothrix]MEB3117736.1 helix-turn-helix domain-containing protein [Limnothrix sp.]OCQ98074.1 transcriptional regulator [Limnothrix sp. P13C2]RFP63285.1 MAG: helix-turn-helix domain-containing protein [Limnothrix sp. CACIAM 69d]MBD2161680.1 helix-turn-helix domain-containing protein [Limnothrix sp. FACHB-1083]MBD2192743.1 helix-turn-helix domain-containing protein [Limnothrix sp. FACHB-1088]